MQARWVERVEVPKVGRAEYLDRHLTGLGLRVSSSGRKTWYVLFRTKGDPKLKRLTLGSYPAMSLADARERAQEVLLAADRGLDPAAEKQEERKAPTFAYLAEEYLRRHAVNKRSHAEDARMLEKDLLPAFGRLKAAAIRRRDVIALLDKIKDRGAPIAANRTLALCRKVYNFGIERDLVDLNPCAQIKRVAPENQRDRVLSDAEIRTLWGALGTLDPVECAFFKLRILTAQRGGEIVAMEWGDVDLESGWWTIPAERAKNGHSHRVSLSSHALALLVSLAAPDDRKGWVFRARTRKTQHASKSTLEKVAHRIAVENGLDFVPHDLRRTAATRMTGDCGVPRLVVSKVLNHAEAGVTRVYDRHSYDAEKRDALDRWADRLEEILAGKPGKIRELAPVAAARKAARKGAAR
ncbi:MAG: tyrosine-type recombinase/integrase [Candidatus Sericytochromatia bacterium]|nr:tyrosine-type recombinase/integrase [Candidatus Tanganyikabacteria bacterium]